MRINGTRFEFTAAGAGKSTGEALIVPLPSQPKPAMRLLSAVDRLCDGAVSELVELAGVPDDVGRLLHTTRRTGFRRVLAVSIGDDARLTPDKLRQAAAKASTAVQRPRVPSPRTASGRPPSCVPRSHCHHPQKPTVAKTIWSPASPYSRLCQNSSR